eukprot:4952333-Ditylum_brightwellii.AAC.1
MAVNISIASTMGLAITPQMSVALPSTSTKDAQAMNMRKHPTRARKYTFIATRPSCMSSCPTRRRTQA